MPTDELIEHMKRRYSTRKNAKDARDPIPIKMKSNDPVGLLMFGDIHVDSPQCNWPGLRAVWPFVSPLRASARRLSRRGDPYR